MKHLIVLMTFAVLAGPVFAQQAETTEPIETADDAQATRPAESSDSGGFIDRVRRAMRLPRAAEEATEAGIPEEEVEEVIAVARERRLPAGEVERVLVESAESARVNGPVDNFGAFVQSQLDQGLRGRALADAIHREHAARGKGPMKDKMRKGPHGKGKGGQKRKDR